LPNSFAWGRSYIIIAVATDPMAQTPFTNDIRTLRFLAGEMTQGDLGDKVGVTRQTIAAIEQGKYSPSLEVAFRIAHVFGKPLEEVFQWTAKAG
jgi:putative transcriptional regulator